MSPWDSEPTGSSMIAARLHAVADLRVDGRTGSRRAAAGLVAARGDLGGHLRVRPALVHRRRHRREPDRPSGRTRARVRRRRAHRAVRRPQGRRRSRDPVSGRARRAGSATTTSVRRWNSPATAPWTVRCGSSSCGRIICCTRCPTSSATTRAPCWSRSAWRSTRWASGICGPGSDVLVVGAGPIGVLAVQVARRARGRPGVRRPNRSSTAGRRRCAAARTGCGRPSTGPTPSWRRPVAAASTSSSRWREPTAAIATAVAASRPGGRIALGGIPSEDTSSFPAAAARRKGLTLAMVRRMNGHLPARDRTGHPRRRPRSHWCRNATPSSRRARRSVRLPSATATRSWSPCRVAEESVRGRGWVRPNVASSKRREVCGPLPGRGMPADFQQLTADSQEAFRVNGYTPISRHGNQSCHNSQTTKTLNCPSPRAVSWV